MSNKEKITSNEEDITINYPKESINIPKTFETKPTLLQLQSTVPCLPYNPSMSTFKNLSLKDITPKMFAMDPDRMTLIIKAEDIMLSSYKNLPKMNYFQALQEAKYDKFGDILEYDFSFSFKNFALFFFYHFLYYLFLGPFAYFLLRVWKGRIIAHNLSFTIWNPFCKLQALEYFLILTSFILFLVARSEGTLYGGELYTIFISVIFWICTISIKYATMCKEKIRYLHEKWLTYDEILSESTILYKSNKSDLEKHIMKELFSVISRNDIDVSLFQIKFIGDLESNVQKILIENEKELNGKTIYSENNKKYSGLSLVSKIINLGFTDNFDSKTFDYISLVVSIVFSLIPFFYKFIDGKIYIMNGGTIFISLLLSATNALFYYKNMNFGLNILFEYKKLAVILSHLSQLLSPKPVLYYNSKKIFPTLDIFTPTILESWDIMHKICRNFDKKLRFRIDCFISLAIILNMAGAIGVIFILLDQKAFKDFYAVSIFLNIVFATLIACGLIKYGIVINGHYDVHKKIIMNNMKVYSDLSNHYSLYFDQEEGKFENLLYQEGTLRIKNFSYDYCIKANLECTEEQFFVNLKKTRINLLKNLRKISKNMMVYLEFQSKNEPFKIMGIPATSPILTSILGLVVSFFIAILQLAIKKYIIGVTD